MTKIDKQVLLNRGWKELFRGFPAELFYAPLSNEPWVKLPHLHINHKVNRNLHSFTYKNINGVNSTLYRDGKWDKKNVEKALCSALADEIKFIFESSQ